MDRISPRGLWNYQIQLNVLIQTMNRRLLLTSEKSVSLYDNYFLPFHHPNSRVVLEIGQDENSQTLITLDPRG